MNAKRCFDAIAASLPLIVRLPKNRHHLAQGDANPTLAWQLSRDQCAATGDIETLSAAGRYLDRSDTAPRPLRAIRRLCSNSWLISDNEWARWSSSAAAKLERRASRATTVAVTVNRPPASRRAVV
jgi:hypothetical protein